VTIALGTELTIMGTRVTNEIRVKFAAEIPTPALEAFYDGIYPRRAAFLKRHWRWLYRVENCQSPLVAMLGDQVVGHLGLIKVTLRRNHEERTALWFLDLAILPGHQRKGIGTLLAEAGMAISPLHIAFGNERSVRMLLKCGWEARFHTFSSRLCLRPDRHPRIRTRSMKTFGAKALTFSAGLAIRSICRAPASLTLPAAVSPITLDSLTASFGKELDSVLHVSRSAEFLHWRLLTHPCAEEYFVLSLPGRNEVCSAIARVVEDDEYRRLHLLTLRGDRSNRRALTKFFASVIRWSIKEDIHDVLLITSDPALVRIAGWWFPWQKSLRFVCHSNDPSGKEFLSGTDHVWEAIDSDFDLMYVNTA
jgi:GNAT superfamily N-acetyltransferase